MTEKKAKVTKNKEPRIRSVTFSNEVDLKEYMKKRYIEFCNNMNKNNK
jgi:hypothetical protein